MKHNILRIAIISALFIALSACQTTLFSHVDITTLIPLVETDAVAHSDDAADDPAIWVNANNVSQSRVLGTDKQGGLAVYDMSGKQVQFLAVGRINNIDLRTGFTWQNSLIDIAVASNRDENALEVFAINPESGEVSTLAQLPTEATEIYGLCMHKSPEGKFYAIANDKDGRFYQYLLEANSNATTLDSNQTLTATLAREFRVASQPEGCVADDRNERLYVGEEEVGVWTLSANPNLNSNQKNSSPELTSVIKAVSPIKADIEGLALYQTATENYLVISSQGNNRYVVIDAQAPYAIRGVFKIGANTSNQIDGTSETDGLEVTSANLGGEFSQGMLVVQDDRNKKPSSHRSENQNFKYIAWKPLMDSILGDTSSDSSAE